MPILYRETPFIVNPEPNTEYRFPSALLSRFHSYEPSIPPYLTYTFNGMSVESIKYVDVSALKIIWKESSKITCDIFNHSSVKFYPITSNTLPLSIRDIISASSYWSFNQPDLLLVPIKINQGKDSTSISSLPLEMSQSLLTLNETIKSSFTSTLRDYNVEVIPSEYPIFSSLLIRSKEDLDAIANDFLKVNQDKINEQYALTATDGYCHIRAHFLHNFFNARGVDNYKIFKFWYPCEWSQYEINRSWRFHCALLLFDNTNQPWVFDPWIGDKNKLMSLTAWTISKNEPIPKTLMVSPGFMTDYPYDPHPPQNINDEPRNQLSPCGPLRSQPKIATDKDCYPFINIDGILENPAYYVAYQKLVSTILKLEIEKPLQRLLNPHYFFRSPQKKLGPSPQQDPAACESAVEPKM